MDQRVLLVDFHVAVMHAQSESSTGRPRPDEIAKCLDSFSQKHNKALKLLQLSAACGMAPRQCTRASTHDNIDRQVQPTLPANLIYISV
jgi:hypothetical protein